jgi:hypothetical protein
MVNRSIQQKLLKMKRRNRHAVFSGETAKYATRIDRGRFEGVTKTSDGDVVPSGKHVVITVGPVSLSRAVVNTGRGPDKERMNEYYERTRSLGEPVPPTRKGQMSTPQYEMELFKKTEKFKEFILGLPREMHVNYYKDDMARMDLYFKGKAFFWVETDYSKKLTRRSAVYPSKKLAETLLELDNIRWVETTLLPAE